MANVFSSNPPSTDRHLTFAADTNWRGANSGFVSKIGLRPEKIIITALGAHHRWQPPSTMATTINETPPVAAKARCYSRRSSPPLQPGTSDKDCRVLDNRTD
jgi:hypothetical protein